MWPAIPAGRRAAIDRQAAVVREAIQDAMAAGAETVVVEGPLFACVARGLENEGYGVETVELGQGRRRILIRWSVAVV